MIYKVKAKAEWIYMGLRCLIKGHGDLCHEPYGPFYCSDCFREERHWRMTIPQMLNSLYCWLVERDWEWFERFDNWIFEKHIKKMPGWWEY
jgi:hypothetical protein